MIIPEFLINMLKENYSDITEIIKGYEKKRYTTLRINSLKATKEEVYESLKNNDVLYEKSSFSDLALIILNKDASYIQDLSIYKEGKIYLQSLSSQIPPIVLNPLENEDILDMAAAPGGKTCQIAAISNNKSRITAVEPNKARSEKLKYNLNMQGAKANILVMDGRKLDDFFSFDKILLDAPCSGTGTIQLNNPKTYKSISKELIINSSKLQLELLLKALKMLKKGQTMVYSTCSILSIENEDVLLKAKSKINFEILPIEINLPSLKTKIENVKCIMPNEFYEGFFVAKLKKL